MDKGRKRRWVVERVKDVLILLLTLSALWLGTRSQLLGPMREYFKEETAQVNPFEARQEELTGAVRPLRMVASLESDAKVRRYAVQYDQTAVDELFQQVASLFAETLSAAGAAEQTDRAGWENALVSAPCVAFDFQGQIPMEVLTGWLTADADQLHGIVRRLVMTVEEDAMALYYRDEESGNYYRCLSGAEQGENLSRILAELTGNQSVFAFELEEYKMLAPDTLIQEGMAAPKAYSASNPVGNGRDSLEELMVQLGFQVSGSNFYTSGNEQVARSGNNSIRLSDEGMLVYQAEEIQGNAVEKEGNRSISSLFEKVELCRQLAAGMLETRCGEARLYLQSVRETAYGTEVCFDYCLNGVPVQLKDGCAARFWVKNSGIVYFEVYFRSYMASEVPTGLLPVRQALAALTALGLEGEELQLVYSDTGEEVVTAEWAAVNHHLEEG